MTRRDRMSATTSELRAEEAERALERNRREAVALFASTSSTKRAHAFPRSATLRWLLGRSDIHWLGPVALTLASPLGRFIIRRFAPRRR
jgi:hypothetical protein